MNKKIVIAGPLLSSSGYGVHSRQIAQWALEDLEPMGWTVQFATVGWGNTPNFHKNNSLIQKIKQRITKIESRPDIFIHIALPNEWQTIGKLNIGITAAVETTKANPEWKKHCDKMNIVVVPSQHAANSLLLTGVNKYKIKVIPESYIPEVQEPQKKLPLELSTNKNLLIFGQITGDKEGDRKNTIKAIEIFLNTFKDNKEIGLVVKTNVARHTTTDREASKKALQQVVKEIRGDSEYPKVHFLHGYMTDSEIAALYQHPQISGLYSCTRGEGFGLPLLEAAVAGLPVVASNWSSHPEFLNHGKWIKLDGELIDIPLQKVSNYEVSDKNIFIKESKWFEVNSEKASETLLSFFEKLDINKDNANTLRKVLRKEYSHKKIKKLYNNLVKGV